MVDTLRCEGSAADNYLVSAFAHSLQGAFEAANSATHAAELASAQFTDALDLRRAAHSGVKVDHLDFGEAEELFQDADGIREFQGLVPALNKLHRFAAHEVDAGNDHRILDLDFGLSTLDLAMS